MRPKSNGYVLECTMSVLEEANIDYDVCLLQDVFCLRNEIDFRMWRI
jgi:hypothetical protein